MDDQLTNKPQPTIFFLPPPPPKKKRSYSDIARLLLRHDPSLGTALLEARIGEENEYHRGCTPLLLAALGGHWRTVGLLLEEGECVLC